MAIPDEVAGGAMLRARRSGAVATVLAAAGALAVLA
jgi:hypothetical protein